jgi:hypothetical protein
MIGKESSSAFADLAAHYAQKRQKRGQKRRLKLGKRAGLATRIRFTPSRAVTGCTGGKGEVSGRYYGVPFSRFRAIREEIRKKHVGTEWDSALLRSGGYDELADYVDRLLEEHAGARAISESREIPFLDALGMIRSRQVRIHKPSRKKIAERKASAQRKRRRKS